MGDLFLSPFYYKVRNYTRRAILDKIRFIPGGISRAELARQMDITRSAISSIVNDLLEVGLIREAESGPATGGRRPIMLEINPEFGTVLGIDIGATHVTLVLSDFSAQILQEYEFSFDIKLGPLACLAEIDRKVHQMLSKTSREKECIRAVGIGVPGPVNAEAGVVNSPPIMPGWDDYPIRLFFEERWKCPVSLNNDAELGALGEWAYGAGRGERYMSYIKVGTGIGSGLLLDGAIYTGATGCAGEIGHITIRDNGPVCTCGNHGCLEALAGGWAIARNGQQAVKAKRRTQLASIETIETITALHVAEAARSGDLVAQQIMADAGNYLGIAIASMVNLINPRLVIIGGGVAQVGDLLLEPIRSTVKARSLPAAYQPLRIYSAVLGRRSSSVGAVVQAINVALNRQEVLSPI